MIRIAVPGGNTGMDDTKIILAGVGFTFGLITILYVLTKGLP